MHGSLIGVGIDNSSVNEYNNGLLPNKGSKCNLLNWFPKLQPLDTMVDMIEVQGKLMEVLSMATPSLKKQKVME